MSDAGDSLAGQSDSIIYSLTFNSAGDLITSGSADGGRGSRTLARGRAWAPSSRDGTVSPVVPRCSWNWARSIGDDCRGLHER